jgi:hypothetical protein
MFKLSEFVSEKVITYPEIRKLKGKYLLSDSDFAKITGDKCYQTFKSKLNGKSEFTGSDKVNIYLYFKNLGEDVSIQSLFFDWVFSIEKFTA